MPPAPAGVQPFYRCSAEGSPAASCSFALTGFEGVWNPGHLNAKEKPEDEDCPGDVVLVDGIVEHDMQVGELLAALDRLDLADDTIVFYSTDDGELTARTRATPRAPHGAPVFGGLTGSSLVSPAAPLPTAGAPSISLRRPPATPRRLCSGTGRMRASTESAPEDTMKRPSSVPVIAVLAVVALSALSAVAQDAPERWRGRIAALSGPAGGQSAYLTLQADQWTSDATIQQLAATLVDKGEQALLKELTALPVAGWIVIGDGLRYNMRTMRSFDLPDGSRLVRSLTDRPIQIGEIMRPTISRNYGFGLVELYLKADGTGEGRVIPAAQIEFENGQVEVTSFGTQPFVVVQVAPEKVQGKKK